MTLILGIESSCDETAAAVVRDGHAVLSNVIASQHDLHERFGGVVPEIASRAHLQRILPVIDESLTQARVTLNDLDAIAVGHRPGLIGSLLVGVAAAKSLAWSLHKPLLGVDHVRAHLYAGLLDPPASDKSEIGNRQSAIFPALGLVVSGGHTSLYSLTSPLDMSLLGRTIDDALGECYDKVAAILGLGFPGGPLVDQLAQRGNPDSISFPRTLLEPDSLDFSFSGIKTSVLYHVRGIPTRDQRKMGSDPISTSPEKVPSPKKVSGTFSLSDQHKADICASFQRTVIDILITKLARALHQSTLSDHQSSIINYKSLFIGGGVSANSLLRHRAADFAKQHHLNVRLSNMAYCLDNAAMLAGLAHHRFIASDFDDLTLEAVATTDLR